MKIEKKIFFYATWQEASKVCIRAGIKGSTDYKERYFLIDDRLPSVINKYYSDWPGWDIFLERTKIVKGPKKDLFDTWQEASRICIQAGVTGYPDYFKRYKQISPKLHSNPAAYYEDWPGWDIFLKRTHPRGKKMKALLEINK